MARAHSWNQKLKLAFEPKSMRGYEDLSCNLDLREYGLNTRLNHNKFRLPR